MKNLYSLILLLFFAMFLVACKTTNETVLDNYSDEIQQKRDQFKTIFENLPPLGTVVENTYCEGKESYPAAVMMDTQLLVPEAKYNQFHLTKDDGELVEGDLLRVFDFVGTDHYFLEKTDNGRFKPFIEQALSLNYIVVNRIVEHIPSELATGPSGYTFLPGYVELEGFVISLENNEILCQYHVTAITEDAEIGFSYQGKDLSSLDGSPLLDDTMRDVLSRDPEKERRAAEWALVHALKNSARAKVDETLAEITSGKYELVESHYTDLLYNH